MEAKLYNQAGAQIGLIEVSDYIFGIEPNKSVMHQAMVRQLANARRGSHNTLGRGEVRGSTRKLYRQKGTGRARAGASRSPTRRGGGVAHGPHPRSYKKKMPRKMRRLAIRSALSAKQAEEQIRFVDELAFDEPRTRNVIELLEDLRLEGKTLIVLDAQDQRIIKSAGNLQNVKTLLVNYLNVIDLLTHDYVIMPVEAVKIAAGFWGDGDEIEIELAPEPIYPAPLVEDDDDEDEDVEAMAAEDDAAEGDEVEALASGEPDSDEDEDEEDRTVEEKAPARAAEDDDDDRRVVAEDDDDEDDPKEKKA